MNDSPKEYTEEIPLESPYFTQLLREQLIKLIEKALRTVKGDRRIPCLVVSNDTYGFVDVALNGQIGATPTIIYGVPVASHVVPFFESEGYVTAINGSMNNLMLTDMKYPAVKTRLYASTTITSTTYTMKNYMGVLPLDCTGGSMVITLPDVVPMWGHYITFKRLNAGANTITINPYSAGQTIDGAANYLLPNQWQKVCILAHNGVWLVMHT